MSEKIDVAAAIREAFLDSNGNSAVDAINELASAGMSIANAISVVDAFPGKDEAGGTVSSLTEAVMGATSGLCRIAASIDRLAEAIRERGSQE